MDGNALAYMESFYMALADSTRLRILNLIRHGEVCVCFFAEVLGSSQPKISRHLAYLRNAGIVKARREGKWVHYSIVEPKTGGGKLVLEAALDWLDDQAEMRKERSRYDEICSSPELIVQVARTPIKFVFTGIEGYDEQVSETFLTRDPVSTGHNEIDEFLL